MSRKRLEHAGYALTSILAAAALGLAANGAQAQGRLVFTNRNVLGGFRVMDFSNPSFVNSNTGGNFLGPNNTVLTNNANGLQVFNPNVSRVPVGFAVNQGAVNGFNGEFLGGFTNGLPANFNNNFAQAYQSFRQRYLTTGAAVNGTTVSPFVNSPFASDLFATQGAINGANNEFIGGFNNQFPANFNNNVPTALQNFNQQYIARVNALRMGLGNGFNGGFISGFNNGFNATPQPTINFVNPTTAAPNLLFPRVR